MTRPATGLPALLALSCFAVAGITACGSDSVETEEAAETSGEEETVAPVTPVAPVELGESEAAENPEGTRYDIALPDQLKPSPPAPDENDSVDAEEINAFPTGLDTPEGAACDLARAFIECDVDWFLEVCVLPLGSGQTGEEYQDFLDQVAGGFEGEREQSTPSPYGPKRLIRTYKARALSLSGPASYGDVVMNLNDIKFVDVITELHSGETFKARTLVLQDRNGAWRVLPCPDVYPLLSAGLNDEANSTEVLFEVE
jgi:hypothetical protein